MPARLPDFLGIGTQKGGTTSLHQWLEKNPHAFVPECKEIHYFDLKYEKPLSWYSEQFISATQKQKRGEITPYYMFHPLAAQRIKNDLPNVKMIVLLRDPVERTISHLMHAKKRGYEPLTPEEAVEEEGKRLRSGDALACQRNSYVSRSKYIEQINRYEKLFNRSQILVLKSEDMFKGNRKIWTKIQSFLQIDEVEIDEIPCANQGINLQNLITQELRNKLKEELRDTAEEVRKRYGFGWEWHN